MAAGKVSKSWPDYPRLSPDARIAGGRLRSLPVTAALQREIPPLTRVPASACEYAVMPSKHETMRQGWFNAGPASQTLEQR